MYHTGIQILKTFKKKCDHSPKIVPKCKTMYCYENGMGFVRNEGPPTVFILENK